MFYKANISSSYIHSIFCKAAPNTGIRLLAPRHMCFRSNSYSYTTHRLAMDRSITTKDLVYLKGARCVLRIWQCLWNLTRDSVALLPSHPPNFKDIACQISTRYEHFYIHPISRGLDFARSFCGTCCRILKGTAEYTMWAIHHWNTDPLTKSTDSLTK